MRDGAVLAAPSTGSQGLPASGLEQAFHDPVDGESGRVWLAAFEPVLVTSPAGKASDTGWMVIVQERGTGR